MGMLAGLGTAGGPVAPGVVAAAADEDDPRGGWLPASEGGEPEDLQGPRRFAEDAVPRDGRMPEARPAEPVRRVREIPERRTESSKVFQLSDGSLQQELSAGPQHYRDAAGRWQPIDTTVGRSGRPGFALGNETNGFRTYFGANPSELVRFETDHGAVSLSTPGAQPGNPAADKNTVTYANGMGQGRDLAYEVQPEALKESIVLRSRPAGEGDVTVEFGLGLEGLVARPREDGSIAFERPGGDGGPLLVIPAPFMTDAADDVGSPYGTAWSPDVTQELSEDGTRLTITADGEWLRAPEREYPVVIDPTIRIVPTPTESQDTMILSSSPASNFEDTWRLSVGTTDDGVAPAVHKSRALLKFPLDDIPDNTDITTAQLQLYYDQYHTSGTPAVEIEARQATHEWTEIGATWNTSGGDAAGELGNYTAQVDNGELFTSPTGSWPSSTNTSQTQHAVNDNFLFNSGATTGDGYSWSPCLGESGSFKVGIHYVTASDRATNAPVTVNFTGGSQAHSLNQSAATVAGKWTDYGPYNHNAGCFTGNLALRDVANKVVVADAVRWVKEARVTRPANDNGSQWHHFSVENIVQKWVNETAPNQGFVVKAVDESVRGQGGPRYEASQFGYNGEGANRPRLVVTYPGDAVTLNLPTTFHATGAELSWPKYVNSCGALCPENNLVEYQVHRSVHQTFTPSASTLVAPVAAPASEPAAYTFTDTTAEPTPADNEDDFGDAYYYMVAVKTVGGTITPGSTRLARLPKAGRVKKIFYAESDTTLSSGEPNTGHDTMFGEPWMYAGNNIAPYGVTRSLVKFPALTGIPTSSSVVDAEVRLWNRELRDVDSTWEMRALTRDFNEAQATWNRANSSTLWTTAGGDVGPVVADMTGFTNDPTRRRFGHEADDEATVESMVQGWVGTPTSNKGVLVKLANEATPLTRAAFLSSEGAEPELGPELWVTYMEKTPEATYHAPDTPEVVEEGSTVTVPVTFTNTTPNLLDDAAWRLSYRWTNPDGTAVTAPQLQTELPGDVASGASVTLNAQVQAPAQVADSNQRAGQVLNWDLSNSAGTVWLSGQGPTNGVGALKQSLAVEDSTSDQVGLEGFYAYAGSDTGAGSAVVNNLHAGNAVWSYDMFSNPSRGLSTFVRLAYNSKDVSDSVAGFGWSLQASSLMRLGTPLDPHPNGHANEVSLTDGDGTTHVWELTDDKGNTNPLDDVYTHPHGVHLHLQRLAECQPNNVKDPESRAWVMTKPDRTQFFFDCAGYTSAIVDKNGNTMNFVYEERRSNNQPIKFLRYIEDATGRRTLTIDYWAKGENYELVNDTTWTRQPATNLTNPFIIDHVKRITDISGRDVRFFYTDKGLLGELVDGNGSAQPKTFKFRYDMTQGNKNVKLVRVTDPRGGATNLAYYSNPEDDPKYKWSTKTVTDRRGFATNFAYSDPDGTEGQHIVTTVTDAETNASTFETDQRGRPISSTNALDQDTTLTWDDDNNVTELVENNGSLTTWDYDPKTGYPLLVKDPVANDNSWGGTQLRYQVGLDGHIADLIEKQSSEGRLWTFAYTGEGDLASVTDPMGPTTSDPDDYKTTYSYDEWGQLDTATDANGNATEYGSYAPSGSPQTITDALDKDTTFVYDVRGQVTQVTDALGKVTTQAYDTYGRPLQGSVPKRQAQGELVVTPAPIYDANDNVTQVTGPELWDDGVRVGDAGAVSQASYNAGDLVDFTLAPLDEVGGPQRKTSFTYDDVGNLLTTTEPNGNATPTAGDFTTTNVYDDIYQLTDVVNAEGDTLSYRYDDVGNVTHLVDPRKNLTSDPDDYTTRTVYDRNHRPVTVHDGVAEEVTGYDQDGLVVSHEDKAGNVTNVTLDARGAAVEVEVPHSTSGSTINYRTTQFTYDEVGNQTEVISPRGLATAAEGDFVQETVYDHLNRVEEQLTPFDPADPIYNTPSSTTYTYDDVGRLAKVSAPPSATQTIRNETSYTYLDNGWTATAQDPWDITTSYDYNPLGLQTLNRLTPAGAGPADPQSPNRSMTWDYFADGKLRSRSDDGVPVGRNVVVVDNSDPQSASSTGTWPRSSGSTGYHGYDFATHAAGAGTDTFTWHSDVPADGTYEVFVRYPAVAGAATDASYKVTHAGGAQATVARNQTTNAGTWVSLGSYPFTQGAGTVALSQNPDGVVTADAVKLVRSNAGQTDDESRDFEYGYDVNGNLTTISDNSPGTAVDAYDIAYTGLNQVASVEELDGATTLATSSFTYDPNGAVETTTHPATYSAFEYDARNLLSEVTNGTTATDPDPKVTTYTYTPRGERLLETKANANTVDLTYFLDGALKTMVERRPGETLVSSHELTYDANGNRATDVARKMNADNNSAYLDTTFTYTYDPRDRLAGVERTGAGAGTETYVHDANDNVVSQTVDGQPMSFAYDRNRLMTSQVGPFVTGHIYDPFGRLQSQQVFGIEQSRYVYDGFDRVQSHRAGAKTTTYVYDPLDRTASKTTDAGTASAKTTDFNYLGLSGEVLEEEVAGVVTKSFQYSPWGERLSQVTHKPGGVEEDGFYGYNPHSDVETLTGPDGNTDATYGYTAYGTNLNTHFTGVDKPVAADPTKEPYNPYRFNAKRWDQNSNQYDMGFRNYSPGLNRFTSRDWYMGSLADLNLGTNPYTSNRYAFTSGNPINRNEMDGHEACGSDTCRYNVAGHIVDTEPNFKANTDWAIEQYLDDRIADSEMETLPGGGTVVLGPQCEGEIACSPSNAYVDTDCGWGCFRDTLWSLTLQSFADCMRSEPKMSWEEIKAGLGEWDACDQAAVETVTASLFGGKGSLGGAASGDDLVDAIQRAADQAAARVGPGRGAVHGTRVHSEFARQLTALGRTDVFSEVSYLNGRVVPYGTRGGVRLDVVVGSPGAPIAVYDLKTGSATLTAARIAQIRSHLPGGYQNVPVEAVTPT